MHFDAAPAPNGSRPANADHGLALRVIAPKNAPSTLLAGVLTFSAVAEVRVLVVLIAVVILGGGAGL